MKYKLVPVEPTEEMVRAFKQNSIDPECGWNKNTLNGYKAMLDHAPTVDVEAMAREVSEDLVSKQVDKLGPEESWRYSTIHRMNDLGAYERGAKEMARRLMGGEV